jgi:hypothetical protein
MVTFGPKRTCFTHLFALTWCFSLSLAVSSQASAAETAPDPRSCRDVLLSNDVPMPSVGCGTAAMNGAETERVVALALNAGFRHFDGAEALEWYDDAAVGRALAKAFESGVVDRAEVFVSSKVHPKHLGRELTTKAVLAMLETLQISYIDSVLLHFPECGDHIRDCVGIPRAPGECFCGGLVSVWLCVCGILFSTYLHTLLHCEGCLQAVFLVANVNTSIQAGTCACFVHRYLITARSREKIIFGPA